MYACTGKNKRAGEGLIFRASVVKGSGFGFSPPTRVLAYIPSPFAPSVPQLTLVVVIVGVWITVPVTRDIILGYFLRAEGRDGKDTRGGSVGRVCRIAIWWGVFGEFVSDAAFVAVELLVGGFRERCDRGGSSRCLGISFLVAVSFGSRLMMLPS